MKFYMIIKIKKIEMFDHIRNSISTENKSESKDKKCLSKAKDNALYKCRITAVVVVLDHCC